MTSEIPPQVHEAIQVAAAETGFEPADSRVEEVAPDSLLVSWPALPGGPLPLFLGQVLIVRLQRGDRDVEFEATVMEARETPIPLVRIRPATPQHSAQRRNDCRVSVFAPVLLRLKVVEMQDYRNSGSEMLSTAAEATNISAGGFSVHLTHPVRDGTLFEAQLTLPGDCAPPLAVDCRVIRCIACHRPEQGPGVFDVAMAFSHLPESARQRIVRFVFDAQREIKD
jgi:c-di-GMP-binding flagellar brake protein YcgR